MMNSIKNIKIKNGFVAFHTANLAVSPNLWYGITVYKYIERR